MDRALRGYDHVTYCTCNEDEQKEAQQLPLPLCF